MQQQAPTLTTQGPTNPGHAATASQNATSAALGSTLCAAGPGATTSGAGYSCSQQVHESAGADGAHCAQAPADNSAALHHDLIQRTLPQHSAETAVAASSSPAAEQAAEQDRTCKPPQHARSATFADSSDLEESSSEVSSSLSPVDHHLSLESVEIYDNGAFVFDPTSEQQVQQRQSSSSLGTSGNQQQQQMQLDHHGPLQQGSSEQSQQQASSSRVGWRQSSSHDGKDKTADVRLADPDYEVPRGKLTETQVLLSHADKLHLDRYGFIVSQDEAAARSKRTSAQVRRDQRHVQKWRRMLGSSREEFEAYWASRPGKVKRRVRKGIPDEFRGLVWQYLSGGRELMQQYPGQYCQLLTTSNDAVDMEIMRDLNRTFPNHVFFHQRQGPGQQSLFHVLRAYSAYDSTVGYVQGMGFVTAILLMYMSEEEAFWTLVALLKGTMLHPPLEGMYQAGMPLLQQCLYQFQELLKQENPKLGGHLEQEGVVPSMYCTHWFNTIFAYSLPFEQLLRVWDVFLLEGMKVVFRVGIVLLSSAQEQLIAMPFEKLVGQLNSKTKFPVLSRHPDVLIRAALRIPVSKRLEVLRGRHQQMAAAVAAGSCSSDGGGSNANGSQHLVVTPVNSLGPKE